MRFVNGLKEDERKRLGFLGGMTFVSAKWKLAREIEFLKRF